MLKREIYFMCSWTLGIVLTVDSPKGVSLCSLKTSTNNIPYYWLMEDWFINVLPLFSSTSNRQVLMFFVFMFVFVCFFQFSCPFPTIPKNLIFPPLWHDLPCENESKVMDWRKSFTQIFVQYKTIAILLLINCWEIQHSFVWFAALKQWKRQKKTWCMW